MRELDRGLGVMESVGNVVKQMGSIGVRRHLISEAAVLYSVYLTIGTKIRTK